MSPDLEWRVDDPSGEQTIAKTTPRLSRWRGIVIGLIVCLGVGFGVIYTSLPESPKPVSTPAPIPSPASPAMPMALYQTIVREASALQTGQSSELIDLLDAEDQQYQPYRAESGNFRRWGTTRTGSLFNVGDFGFINSEHAWADVSQYREGRLFHETRFYRPRNDQWKRTNPEAALWSGQPLYVDTVHFRIAYWPFDQKVVPESASKIEHDYEQLCTDLECDIGPRQCVTALDRDWCSSFTTSPTITLQLRGSDWPQFPLNNVDPRPAIQLPSPRVTGFYDTADPLPYSRSAASGLIASMLVRQAAYGRIYSFGPAQNGEILVVTILGRVMARLQPNVADIPIEDYLASPYFNSQNLRPLASLWEKIDSINADRMYAEASVLIRYIEQTHGWPTVVKLLKSIKQADSMSRLIELSLDLPLADFEQQWQTWLESHVP